MYLLQENMFDVISNKISSILGVDVVTKYWYEPSPNISEVQYL